MARRIGNGSKEFFGYQGLNKRENYKRRSLGDPKEGNLRWKLFHREERPAVERHIIDTSEWTFANHRCVMGKHFGFDCYTSGLCELAALCKAIWTIVHLKIEKLRSRLFTARASGA